MKAIFEIKTMKEYIASLLNTINKGGLKEAYEYLLIEVKDKHIYISGYNDFFVVQYEFDIIDGNNGMVCVNGKKFLNLMKLSHGKCTISDSENSLNIIMDSANYKLNIMNYIDFNNQVGVPNFDSSKEGFTFDTNYLKYKINSIAHCLSKDSSILAFNNICFHKKMMIACDGSYGAVAKINTDKLHGYLLNQYSLYCINACNSKQINLSMDNNAIYGYGDSMKFICYTETIDYPAETIVNFVDKFENSSNNLFQVNLVPETFRDALARLIGTSSDEQVIIKLQNDILELSSYSLGDSGIEDIQISGEMPEGFKIIINGKILGKMLSVFDGDIQWSCNEDIQYFSDNELLQIFKPLKED